ncbi:hypothetical protein [Parendozoicomonas sp. Alg238-R29]|uniref:hypothetical protein n=1 Tax=Parendozoicomonas sp. Alg238-R29 TaxID=2993446 RepID=UPI00248E0677|nr:hypothetical protein [Parendozoicomonas sp. Alg238-R29]
MDNPLTDISTMIHFLESGTYNETSSFLHTCQDLGYQIKLEGDLYHGNIPSSVVHTLPELQQSVLRAYCLFTRNSTNTRLLTSEEREALQLDFTLKKGSSGLGFVFKSAGKLLKTLDGVMKDMESNDKKQTLIALFSILFLGVGVHYISGTYERIQIDQQQTETAIEIENIHSQNLNMLGELIKETQHLAQVAIEAGKGQAAPILAAPNIDKATIAGSTLSPSDVQALKQRLEELESRSTKVETNDYYIDGYVIDRKNKQARVTLTNPSTLQPTTAKVSTDLLSKGEGKILRDSVDTSTILSLEVTTYTTPKKTTRVITQYIGLASAALTTR